VSDWVTGVSTSKPKIMNINSAGTEIFTSANPANVQVSGSTLIEANVTLTGIAQQLATATCRNITIQAEPTNTGYLYVGRTSNVSSTVHSYTLSPGSSVKIGCSNANLVYIIGTLADKVCYGGEA